MDSGTRRFLFQQAALISCLSLDEMIRLGQLWQCDRKITIAGSGARAYIDFPSQQLAKNGKSRQVEKRLELHPKVNHLGALVRRHGYVKAYQARLNDQFGRALGHLNFDYRVKNHFITFVPQFEKE